ncbi:MAG: type IV pilus biogenesis/stability protein PilW [Gammaproteobacteria bacterium]|nr:type IV pilus biogenesis/stability protein PilW [Gammaproteobacteria bacterium]
MRVVKLKVLFGISLCSVLSLTGCVSKQSYVGSDKPVSDRTFDNIEAARTRISLGLNYLRRGDTSQAKYNLERARSFAPNSAEVHSALAYYYQSVGENKQAEEYFRLSISKDVNYADAYNNFGAFLCQLNRYDEAEQLLLKAISRPGYIRVAESYENLAQCQLQQNNFNKSSAYLDSSISHNSTRITSLTMAAGMAYAMGDIQQAKARLDRIQRLGRVSARTVLLSYLIAEKAGDRETLRNAEQLLLTLYTDTPETRLLLQGKTQDSEFEQLRERYKDSLMANIVVPDENAVKPQLPAKPVANPKLKIVKRKTADGETDSGATALVRPLTEQTNTASAIAGALAANSAETVLKADETAAKVSPELVAEVPAEVPAEVIADNDVDNRQPVVTASAVTAAAVAPEPLPEEALLDGAAEQVNQMQDKQLAEQVEPISPAEKQLDDAEQVAANVVAQQDEIVTLPEPVPEPQPVEQVQQAVDLVTDSDAEVLARNEDESVVTQLEDNSAVLTEVDSAELEVDSDATDEQPAEVPFHIVQAAESLYAISVKHNIRLSRLMQWNELTPESVIKTGQKIWLGEVAKAQLNPETLAEREQVQALQPYHTVAAGETMFGISYRYNIRLEKFMAWNNLNNTSTLQVGQRVYVVDPESVTQ